MSVRVAISATTSQGRSEFVGDVKVDPVISFQESHEIWPIWGEDGCPWLPSDATSARFSEVFRGLPDYRLTIFTVPPAGESHEPPARMRPSSSIDFLYVIDGEIWLDLDGGESKPFEAGDVIIQVSALHSWRNIHPTKGAKLLLMFVGAEGD